MVYHLLLVCREGNFGVQLKVAPWWPTSQSFHAVALLRVPCYGVPMHYLHESCNSSCADTLGGTTLLLSSGTLKLVILLSVLIILISDLVIFVLLFVFFSVG